MFIIGILLFGFFVLLYWGNAFMKNQCYNKRDLLRDGGQLSMEDRKLQILLNEYEELRNELKQRIEQRDNFSVQFVVACCAVLALTVSIQNGYLVALLPVITVFFATQIFESYRVHERLVEFIRDTIEKKICELVSDDMQDCLWETHCKHIRELTLDNSMGGRKRFFPSCTDNYAYRFVIASVLFFTP